ncbi:MAG: hypothetical protein RIM72_17440 [Alphaproteobacteria bacterium]
MPAKPNYKFEKKEREKSKALKKADRQKEKASRTSVGKVEPTDETETD